MSAPAASEVRAWQRMLSGRRLDLLNPSPLDVELSDIAHGLARVSRWNGQTLGEQAFSVAQHSLIVEIIYSATCRAASSDEKLMALLHDAPEYVIGDMISPFKAVVGGEYKLVEKRLEAAIHLRFGLPAATPTDIAARIKKADRMAAFFEATTLAGFSEEEARRFFGQPRGVVGAGLPIMPLPPREVQAQFVARFEAIEAERSLAARRSG
ncbi:MAG: hydrolase [Pararhizobium sp.]